MLSLCPLESGKIRPGCVCIIWLQSESERKRDSFGKWKSLSESYESLFPSSSSSSRTVSFRQRHTHTRVSLEGLFFFKRCNFDAIVYFAVSLDVRGKKEYWTTPFYFFFFFFFLGFVFVMKGWREATKSCCSAARTRMQVESGGRWVGCACYWYTVGSCSR